MRHLPDELILQIICYLEPEELVKLQHVSRQFLNLSRDNNLWRALCFEHSAAERRRRRLFPTDDVDPRLAELIRAANEVANAFTIDVHDPTAPSAEVQIQKKIGKRKAALLANWDPSYPGEKVDFYQEFVDRHAPHSLSWFEDAKHGHRDDNLHHEATGAGLLYGQDGLAHRLVAPLEDGSIAIWDASASASLSSSLSSSSRGRIVARTAVGLLPAKGSDLDLDTRLDQSRAAMTETGAVECVSVDSRAEKVFFAVQHSLAEVDLRTLQVVAKTPYPFAISALSEARNPTPLTVGTNWTLHLHDTRVPPSTSARAARCELIGGAISPSFSRLETGDAGGHVSLAQPGALSIAHLPAAREWDANGDIWVAGRFTSLLNFDRRFFPRLRGTVHSGARLSCIAPLPFPFPSRPLPFSNPYDDSERSAEGKGAEGTTLVAAGSYKGKGSLELYALSPDPARTVNSSDARTSRNPLACFQNRQTASASKLLAVAPHGTRLVTADGDGILRWLERDASTLVRSININQARAEDGFTASSSSFPAASPAAPPGTADTQGGGDIVQKVLPTVSASRTSPAPLGASSLALWTGDGRLGLLGFGQPAEFVDAVEEVVEDAEESGVRERERAFAGRMREALEGQAREVRWLRGYGL